jgi:hypothetical protein
VLEVSNSELQVWKQCRRRWYLSYYLRWSVDPAYASPVSYALLGTRVHAALEAYYGYDIDPLAALRFIYTTEIARRPEAQAELTGESSWALTMVEGFLDWAAEHGIDQDYEVVETERVVSAPIVLTNGEPAMDKGKLDQLVRRRLDGALLFRDWKTVGTLHKADLLILDEQFRTYAVIQQITSSSLEHVRVDGGLYTMLLRSKRTARATGPFYEQIEVRYNQTEHLSMIFRLRGVLDDMDRVVQQLDHGVDHRLLAYPSPSPQCSWICPFKNVCPLMDDGSRYEDALRGNFRQHDPYDYYGHEMIDDVKAAFSVAKNEDVV